MFRNLIAACALLVVGGSAPAVPPALVPQPRALQASAPRLIGANGRTPQALLATSATMTAFESRSFFYVGVDTPYVQLSFDNWAIDATGADLVAPTALTIEGAAVESAALTVTRPATFNGARSRTIAAGATAFTDPLQATDFGLPFFKRGTKYWVRVRGSVPANTGRIPSGGRQYNPAGTLSTRFDPTQGSNAVSQVDATGAMTNKTGQDSFGAPISFTAIVGLPLDSRIPSIVAVGDSIGDATSDVATGYQAESGPAFISRASFAPDFTRPVPMLNMARGSSGVVPSSQARRGVYYAFATVAVDEYGTNDVQSTGGGDVPTIQAALTAQWTAMKAAGIGTIIRTKLIPRNTSTDSWATTANQTNVSAFDTKAQALNDWFDAKVADGTLAATLPMAGARADMAANAWKWPVTGTANYATPDGTHPYGAIHLLMAGELRAKLEALFPQIAVAP